MSQPDLYARLGLQRGAPLARIKAAYRKLAMLCHPDQGGDPDEFKEIQEAYDVLSDEAQRLHYDATGQWGKQPDNELAEVFPFLADMFDMALSKAPHPERVDMLRLTMLEIDKIFLHNDEQRRALHVAQGRFRKAKGRAHRKSAGPSIIEMTVDSKLRDIQANLDAMARVEATAAKARKLLEDHSYIFDPGVQSVDPQQYTLQRGELQRLANLMAAGGVYMRRR